MSGLSERVRVLQTRDKSLRENRERHTDIETAIAIVGTCPDMCPEFERYFREETNQLSPLEISADGKPDYHAMVKEYRRAGADQSEPLPHELRPGTVLNRTFDYLVCNVMDRPEKDPAITGEWYDFLWSRTRAIRKDITQQHFCDQTSVALLEKCSRFHIHCAAVLVEEDAAVFDSKINDENLSKCIQSLKDFYQDLLLQGITCANEAEFRSYDILLNLHDSDILREIKHLRREIRDSNEVKFVVSAHFAMTSNNFPLFFKLVRQASYLQACLMHRYFTQVRVNAIRLLRKSYTIPNQTETYPLDLLCSLLGFDDLRQLQTFLEQVDVEYNESENCVLLTRSKTYEAFNTPAPTRSMLVESKKTQLLGEIVHGGPLPPNPYKKFPLHSSFDLKGALKPDARTAADQQKTSDFLKSEETHLQASSADVTPVFKFFQSAPSASTEATGGFSFLQTHKQQDLRRQQEQELQDQQQQQQQNLQHLKNLERRQQLISAFCQEQVDQIIKSVVEEHTRSFARILIKSVKQERVVSIVSTSFTDWALNSIIHETASQVHRNAKEQELMQVRKKKLDRVSLILEEEIFNKFISSIILGLSQTVHQEALRKYISFNSGLLSKQLISDLTDQMVRNVSSEAFYSAMKERDTLVQKMRHSRSMRLASNSFKHWFTVYKKNKHRRHITQTFPASSIENALEIVVSPPIRRSSSKRSNLLIASEHDAPSKRPSLRTSSPKFVDISTKDTLQLSLADELDLSQRSDVMSQLKLLKARIGEVKKETSETKKTIDLLEKSFHFVDQADSP